MKKDQGTKITLEHLLGITSTLLSLIALFFSWQATQIAKQQAQANVIPVSSSYVGGSAEQFNATNGVGYSFTCTQKLRLSNLGGAGASLVKWQANLYYQDRIATLQGEQPYPLDSVNMDDEIQSFLIEFVDLSKEYSQSTASQTFPIQIAPYSTVEVWVKARFSVWRNTSYFYPPYDYYAFLEKGANYSDLIPAEVSIQFTTSTNQQVIESPRALCVFMK